MSNTPNTPDDRADTTSATADVPEMPAPRVREFTAHSIGGGLALLLGLVGL
ncbi:SPFH domain-containing protein, partial [Streptomyces sp. Lzd4kr]|nr:SPFH domain-containing protein [Streptomyces sp. Lzd4kr]